MVALITPFKDGQVEWQTLDALVDFHVQAGTDVLVPCGTTGESPTVDVAEHEKIIETIVKRAAGRIPIIAGAGANATAEAIELARFSKKVGADATLQVCPYYNRPSQEGLYRHFAAIAEAVDLPMVLYNIPGRTGVSLAPETVARLAKFDELQAYILSQAPYASVYAPMQTTMCSTTTGGFYLHPVYQLDPANYWKK